MYDILNRALQMRQPNQVRALKTMSETVSARVFNEMLYWCSSLNECYFANKGAALVLAGCERRRVPAFAPLPPQPQPQSDIQHHLQAMFYLLRPEETLKMVRSALQTLHRASGRARALNHFAGGASHAWCAYYEERVDSDRSCLNEWHAMDSIESRRPPSPDSLRLKPRERDETERVIRCTLKEIMMSVDLDEVTSKAIRGRLEDELDMDLAEYKSFIDQEMLTILGQMDAPTEIFEHVYLGSEWNASNLEELQRNGVRHILNVTREIDNFFPGVFDYLNIRVYDDEKTDLLKHWDNTFKYINKARNEGSKVSDPTPLVLALTGSCARRPRSWSPDTRLAAELLPPTSLSLESLAFETRHMLMPYGDGTYSVSPNQIIRLKEEGAPSVKHIVNEIENAASGDRRDSNKRYQRLNFGTSDTSSNRSSDASVGSILPAEPVKPPQVSPLRNLSHKYPHTNCDPDKIHTWDPGEPWRGDEAKQDNLVKSDSGIIDLKTKVSDVLSNLVDRNSDGDERRGADEEGALPSRQSSWSSFDSAVVPDLSRHSSWGSHEPRRAEPPPQPPPPPKPACDLGIISEHSPGAAAPDRPPPRLSDNERKFNETCAILTELATAAARMERARDRGASTWSGRLSASAPADTWLRAGLRRRRPVAASVGDLPRAAAPPPPAPAPASAAQGLVSNLKKEFEARSETDSLRRSKSRSRASTVDGRERVPTSPPAGEDISVKVLVDRYDQPSRLRCESVSEPSRSKPADSVPKKCKLTAEAEARGGRGAAALRNSFCGAVRGVAGAGAERPPIAPTVVSIAPLDYSNVVLWLKGKTGVAELNLKLLNYNLLTLHFFIKSVDYHKIIRTLNYEAQNSRRSTPSNSYLDLCEPNASDDKNIIGKVEAAQNQDTSLDYVSKNGIIKSNRESTANYNENVKHESDTQDENEEISHSSSNLLDMTNLDWTEEVEKNIKLDDMCDSSTSFSLNLPSTASQEAIKTTEPRESKRRSRRRDKRSSSRGQRNSEKKQEPIRKDSNVSIHHDVIPSNLKQRDRERRDSYKSNRSSTIGNSRDDLDHWRSLRSYSREQSTEGRIVSQCNSRDVSAHRALSPRDADGFRVPKKVNGSWVGGRTPSIERRHQSPAPSVASVAEPGEVGGGGSGGGGGRSRRTGKRSSRRRGRNAENIAPPVPHPPGATPAPTTINWREEILETTENTHQRNRLNSAMSDKTISETSTSQPGLLILPQSSISQLPKEQSRGGSIENQKTLYDHHNPSKPIIVQTSPTQAHMRMERDTSVSGMDSGPRGLPYEASDAARAARHCELLQQVDRADAILYTHSLLGPVALADHWPEVMETRKFLQNALTKLLMSDLKYCQADNIEHNFWKILYYTFIEKLRRSLPQVSAEEKPKVVKLINTIIEEGNTYFENLVHMLEKAYKFNTDDFINDNHVVPPKGLGYVGLALISVQKLYVFLGDLTRYREQVNETNNYAKSKFWYTKAQQINPKNGRPYNQLAILAIYARRKLDAVYYYMRSLMSSNPFQSARESLISLFDENRKKYEAAERKRRAALEGAKTTENGETSGGHGMRKEVWVRPSGHRTTTLQDDSMREHLAAMTPVELNKNFITSYLHVHGKLITKIGQVWSDWMLCHSSVWNPPPSFDNFDIGTENDPWDWLAKLMNILETLDDKSIELESEMKEGYLSVRLAEDSSLAGFTPLMYMEPAAAWLRAEPPAPHHAAEHALRTRKLLFFGTEYLVGVEPPVLRLEYPNNGAPRYVSAVQHAPAHHAPLQHLSEDSEDEDSTSAAASGPPSLAEGAEGGPEGADEATRRLLRRKEQLESRKANLDRRRQRMQEMLRVSGVSVEVEVRPRWLVPDTNCFIDHLPLLQAVVAAPAQPYTLAVPLVVLTELEGLRKCTRVGGAAGAALAWLGGAGGVRFATSKGSLLASRAFTAERDQLRTTNDDRVSTASWAAWAPDHN
ncbi:hypothetical protein MSG28_003416 [Choristoneura fumiferana]|uniref:Uncharacterized protein n=1 Tax=Choristoneura fumiferana TaxID=7141 RepID=A0ACC0KF05_CHOFU|nr:hypothetical protein MSG28_003416 [Choristoneura fumiferana]